MSPLYEHLKAKLGYDPWNDDTHNNLMIVASFCLDLKSHVNGKFDAKSGLDAARKMKEDFNDYASSDYPQRAFLDVADAAISFLEPLS